MPSRDSVTWRYLPGAKIRHAVLVEDAGDLYPPSLCGFTPRPLTLNRRRLRREGGWFGTGSQAEYEHVETLRPCKRCAQSITEMVV